MSFLKGLFKRDPVKPVVAAAKTSIPLHLWRHSRGRPVYDQTDMLARVDHAQKMLTLSGGRGFRTPSRRSGLIDLSWFEKVAVFAGIMRLPTRLETLSKRGKRKLADWFYSLKLMREDLTRGMTATGLRDYYASGGRSDDPKGLNPESYRGLDYFRRMGYHAR